MQLNVKVKLSDLVRVFEERQNYCNGGIGYGDFPSMSDVMENAKDGNALDEIIGGIIRLYKGQATKYLVIKIMTALGVELTEE